MEWKEIDTKGEYKFHRLSIDVEVSPNKTNQYCLGEITEHKPTASVHEYSCLMFPEHSLGRVESTNFNSGVTVDAVKILIATRLHHISTHIITFVDEYFKEL